MNTITIPVAPGELIDRITILEIKLARIGDADKRRNVARELALLSERWQDAVHETPELLMHRSMLKEVNEALWEIEDAIRRKEAAGEFDGRFVELARSVYMQNDRRAATKRAINLALDSDLIEEKSYADYSRSDADRG